MVEKNIHTITIGHMYPDAMNVYGDMGNIITLRYRLEQRGYKVAYKPLHSMAEFDGSIDILLGGGGQDSNQGVIHEDLIRHKKELIAACEDGLVCLMICGMYQMFGRRFVLTDGSEIPGAGVIDIETKAGERRLIGNIVLESPFGSLVGFENHSGRTYLGSGLAPLGTVQKGFGNNGEDGTEGVIDRNIFGTYMHGPALAKNPRLADEILERLLRRRGLDTQLMMLDDSFEQHAADIAASRPQ